MNSLLIFIAYIIICLILMRIMTGRDNTEELNIIELSAICLMLPVIVVMVTFSSVYEKLVDFMKGK